MGDAPLADAAPAAAVEAAAAAPAVASATSAAAGGGDKEEHEGMIFDKEWGWYRKDERVWTMNEIRDHPMFMEDMPRDISDNPHLLALQSLVYDGNTPEQMAEHFRTLGNDAFRSSTNAISSQNALACYTKGLEMEGKDLAVNSQLHSNRAAVSLRLKEYDKAVIDSRMALKLDPTNVKAAFRAAQASDGLKLTAQALDFCEKALAISPKDAGLLQLQTKLKKTLAREDAARAKARETDEAAARAVAAVSEGVRCAIEAKGSRLGPMLFEMPIYRRPGVDIRPRLTEDDATAVQWPLILVYSEYGQTDFVEFFDERCSLVEQLELMFPAGRHAEWDEEGKYVWDRLACYLEVHTDTKEEGASRFLPVEATSPLEETLRQASVLPICLVVHVFVSDHASHAAFRREHGLGLQGP